MFWGSENPLSSFEKLSQAYLHSHVGEIQDHYYLECKAIIPWKYKKWFYTNAPVPRPDNHLFDAKGCLNDAGDKWNVTRPLQLARLQFWPPVIENYKTGVHLTRQIFYQNCTF